MPTDEEKLFRNNYKDDINWNIDQISGLINAFNLLNVSFTNIREIVKIEKERTTLVKELGNDVENFEVKSQTMSPDLKQKGLVELYSKFSEAVFRHSEFIHNSKKYFVPIENAKIKINNMAYYRTYLEQTHLQLKNNQMKLVERIKEYIKTTRPEVPQNISPVPVLQGSYMPISEFNTHLSSQNHPPSQTQPPQNPSSNPPQASQKPHQLNSTTQSQNSQPIDQSRSLNQPSIPQNQPQDPPTFGKPPSVQPSSALINQDQKQQQQPSSSSQIKKSTSREFGAEEQDYINNWDYQKHFNPEDAYSLDQTYILHEACKRKLKENINPKLRYDINAISVNTSIYKELTWKTMEGALRLFAGCFSGPTIRDDQVSIGFKEEVNKVRKIIENHMENVGRFDHQTADPKVVSPHSRSTSTI